MMLSRQDPVLVLLDTYDFDLVRSDREEISDYLKHHYYMYFFSLTKLMKQEKDSSFDSAFFGELKKMVPVMRMESRKIVEILNLYLDGHHFEALSKSRHLFRKYEKYLLNNMMWNQHQSTFFRIRKGKHIIENDEDSKKVKADLFHLKKSMREKIGSYRYSVAGYPCLYLASSPALAWYESGMPNEFTCCKMELDNSNVQPLVVVDFANRGKRFADQIYSFLMNSDDTNKTNICKEVLLKYLVSYPIAAACSVKVKNRSESFVQEYVFPQMIMEYIRESDSLDGVMYKSARYNSLVSESMRAYNVAFPVKSFREDGLGEELTEKILVSNPEFMNISDYFAKRESRVKSLRRWVNRIESEIHKLKYPCCIEMERMISLANQIIQLNEAIVRKDYSNIELLLKTVEVLSDYREQFIESEKQIIASNQLAKMGHRYMHYSAEEVSLIVREFEFFTRDLVNKNEAYHFGLDYKMTKFEKI